MKGSGWSLESSTVAAELKRFVAEKCAQVRAETRAPGHEMGPLSRTLFAAAENADWPRLFETFAAMRAAAREGQSAGSTSNVTVVYPVEWAVVNELGGALEELAGGEEKHAIAFARDIIASIPPGSIYFGGTDSGRFLVTALSRSHINADPFFTLTQNALADTRSYLRYVRGMYGSRIYVPSEEDTTHAFNEYQEDARKRHAAGKLLPGEFFEETGSITELRGQLSVMAINGALSKLMFDKNPEREFYLEESFPLDWMFPHLSPHGLIMKINRPALPEFSREVVQRDHDYWSKYVAPMVGDWLKDDTSLLEIVAFAERVYLSGEMAGFRGDPGFVHDDLAQRRFSKLRSSIAGLYLWRANRAQTPAEKERMVKEADFAFRQAFALCPASPEVVFRYLNLLFSEKRLDDATVAVETAVRLEAQARRRWNSGGSGEQDHESEAESQTNIPQRPTQLAGLLEQLKKMRDQL